MRISWFSLFTLAFLLCAAIPSATLASASSNFLKCFELKTNLSNSSSGVVFTPSTSSYSSILQSPAETPEPEIIIRPLNTSHIQAAVTCAEESNLNIRTQSWGHDYEYEGVSYVSKNIPFILVDLSNLRSIKFDVENNIAWVDSGTTLGELYHAIAEKTNTYGFPAGTCPTVGVGGHFISTGGGMGPLSRKYGLAADNIDDVRMVDAKGRALDRKSMGEGPFQAIIRGASFGIITSWKLKLVPVPTTVTVFNIQRTLEQGATKLVLKWQAVGLGSNFSKDLFIRLVIGASDSASGNSNKTIVVRFAAVYLGPSAQLLTMMDASFPELGVQQTDCIEMSWIQSVLYEAGFPFTGSIDVLLNRTKPNKSYFKANSDYVNFVKEPMSEEGLEGLWKLLIEEEESGYMIWTPYGGVMSEFPVSQTPFPHRNGNLFEIQYYMATWQASNGAEGPVNWIRSLYSYVAGFCFKHSKACLPSLQRS